MLQVRQPQQMEFTYQQQMKLDLHTNSLDRLTIEASGEIGIGTVDPAYTLDITGTFRI